MTDLTYKQLGENLNLLMAKHRLTANELARHINLPATTIKRIRNQEPVNPTLASLLPIARFFKLSLSQLIGDEPLPQTLSYSPAHLSVPILSWEKVLEWETHIHDLDLPRINTDRALHAQIYALIVEDDHWENLAQGTQLIIDPTQYPKHRDFVIAHKHTQPRATLKQVLFDDDQCYLKPLNPSYQTTLATPEHQFLGVVVQYRYDYSD